MHIENRYRWLKARTKLTAGDQAMLAEMEQAIREGVERRDTKKKK